VRHVGWEYVGYCAKEDGDGEAIAGGGVDAYIWGVVSSFTGDAWEVLS